MVYQIPLLNNLYDYRFRIQLGNDFYVFRIFWNGYDGSWFTDVYSGQDVLVIAGLRIVLSQDFLKYFQYTPDLPVGKIRFYDTQGKDIEPTLETLTSQVVMLYQDEI